MRAIDEIEDHTQLPAETKIKLLREISDILKQQSDFNKLQSLLKPYEETLPEVTLKINDWINFAPPTIQPNILHWTAVMANGMAKWVEKSWAIQTEDDLDSYTYYVAGLVGLLLNEIWAWYDQTDADQQLAIAFGRGLNSEHYTQPEKKI